MTTIHELTFPSEALGTTGRALAILTEDAPAPTLVLLRARPEEWLNPHEDESRAGRQLLSVYAELRARGFLSRPVNLLLPQTTNASGDAFISHGRARRPDLIADPRLLGQADMDGFIDELLARAPSLGLLPPFAIDGFSLGGASSVAHALRRPEAFCSVGSFDGAFLIYEFDDPGLSPQTPSDLRFDEMPYLYGFPPDEAAFRSESPIDLARAGARLPPAMIHHSAEEHPQANGHRVRAFLEAWAGDNAAREPILHEHSQHTWWWADEHLYRSLPFHASFLYSDATL